MSLSISEVCEHIPYFSGHTEDLDIFIERCELAQNIIGPRTEFVSVQFIKQKLIGIAADALCEKNINSVHVELISRISQVHFEFLKKFFFVSQLNVNIKNFWNFSPL